MTTERPANADMPGDHPERVVQADEPPTPVTTVGEKVARADHGDALREKVGRADGGAATIHEKVVRADGNAAAIREEVVRAGGGAAAIGAKVGRADWRGLAGELDAYGCALGPQVLSAEECAEVAGLYDEVGRFRATIDMERYRFGAGQYRYFRRPFPDLVESLRAAFYPYLLPIAREWAARLGRPAPWPDDFGEWLDMCHQAGQTKPTPILLRYRANDWNALHRDLYGDLVFPLQVVIGLDRPGEDYTGGEFLLVEQRARAQSRGTSTSLPQGRGLIFTTRDRPVRSARGWSAAPVRHGVSTVRSGLRHTLGLVFHDAT